MPHKFHLYLICNLREVNIKLLLLQIYTNQISCLGINKVKCLCLYLEEVCLQFNQYNLKSVFCCTYCSKYHKTILSYLKIHLSCLAKYLLFELCKQKHLIKNNKNNKNGSLLCFFIWETNFFQNQNMRI